MKALIFDMDGVLIDSEPLHIQTDQQILLRHGIHVKSEELLSFTGMDNAVFFAEMKKKYRIEASVNELIQQKNILFIQELWDRPDIAVKGVQKMCREIQKLVPVRAVASSSFRDVVDTALSILGLERWFQASVAGNEVQLAKPNPEIFIKTAEKLHVLPQDCIVIEDSQNGINGAIAAGMNVIGYYNPLSGSQDLSQTSCIIKSHDELPTALKHFL